jgi:hypothetical protein
MMVMHHARKFAILLGLTLSTFALAEEFVTVETPELVRNPQKFWAQGVVFRDILTEHASGSAVPMGKRDAHRFRTKMVGDCYVDSSLAPALNNLEVNREYTFAGTVYQYRRKFYVVVQKFSAPVQDLTQLPDVLATRGTGTAALQGDAAVLAVVRNMIGKLDADLMSYSQTANVPKSQVLDPASEHRLKFEKSVRQSVQAMADKMEVVPLEVLTQLFVAWLAQKNAQPLTEPAPAATVPDKPEPSVTPRAAPPAKPAPAPAIVKPPLEKPRPTPETPKSDTPVVEQPLSVKRPEAPPSAAKPLPDAKVVEPLPEADTPIGRGPPPAVRPMAPDTAPSKELEKERPMPGFQPGVIFPVIKSGDLPKEPPSADTGRRVTVVHEVEIATTPEEIDRQLKGLPKPAAEKPLEPVAPKAPPVPVVTPPPSELLPVKPPHPVLPPGLTNDLVPVPRLVPPAVERSAPVAEAVPKVGQPVPGHSAPPVIAPQPRPAPPIQPPAPTNAPAPASSLAPPAAQPVVPVAQPAPGVGQPVPGRAAPLTLAPQPKPAPPIQPPAPTNAPAPRPAATNGVDLSKPVPMR